MTHFAKSSLTHANPDSIRANVFTQIKSRKVGPGNHLQAKVNVEEN